MYDILLCPGEGCPFKNYCFRHTAEILGRQNFFGSTPYQEKRNTCDYFYENSFFHSEVQLKAYQIWQNQGCPVGQAMQHWQEAKIQVIQEAIKN
jgi:hypothetical protein